MVSQALLHSFHSGLYDDIGGGKEMSDAVEKPREVFSQNTCELFLERPQNYLRRIYFGDRCYYKNE